MKTINLVSEPKFFYPPHPLAGVSFAIQAIAVAKKEIEKLEIELDRLLEMREKLLDALEENSTKQPELLLATQYSTMILKLTQRIHWWKEKVKKYEMELKKEGKLDTLEILEGLEYEQFDVVN